MLVDTKKYVLDFNGLRREGLENSGVTKGLEQSKNSCSTTINNKAVMLKISNKNIKLTTYILFKFYLVYLVKHMLYSAEK